MSRRSGPRRFSLCSRYTTQEFFESPQMFVQSANIDLWQKVAETAPFGSNERKADMGLAR